MIHILVAINDTIKYLQTINENIDAMKSIVETSNSTIANQIAMVDVVIAIFSLLFAIAGIGLGIYISKLEKRIVKMNRNVEEKERIIISLAKTVEETDNKIQSDISGLYKQLRNEETFTLLNRLELEPKDISNIGNLLLARPLEDNGFPILKNSFLKLISLGDEANNGGGLFGTSYKKQYLLLFFQHYMYFSILDDDLREEIVNDFKHGMNCAFKRDIIKSTEDFCKAISVGGASFDKMSVLIDYLKALNQSKYSNLIELRNILQENINKDLLVDAIDKCTTDNVYLELFGIETPVEPSVEEEEGDKET